MTSRISFYFRQASSNLRRSIMVIISISIIISMVAGVLYYMDSYENTSKINAFNNVFDINVPTSNYEINFSSSMTTNYDNVMQSINKSGLDTQHTFKYAFFYTGYSYIYRDFTDNPEMKSLGLQDNENMTLSVFMADENFYNTSAFSNYFALYKGKLPTNNSEILLDVNAANCLNYHVGEKVNLTMAYRNGQFSFGHYNISDITISGIYYSKILDYYTIIDVNYTNPYTYSNFDSQDFPIKDFSKSPIFSYQNLSNPQDNNPFQIYSNKVVNSLKDKAIYPRSNAFLSGIGIVLDKNAIHLSNLKSYNLDVLNDEFILDQNLHVGYFTQNFISSELTTLINETSTPTYEMLIFIIPFIIFALIIGSFSMTNISSRFDEFLLLKSKGVPKKMIRNQLITEALLIGIISAGLAVLFGMVVFDFDKIWLKSLIFYSEIAPNIHLYISWNSIIEIFLIGIGLSLITSISGIRTMNKVGFSELLTTMGEENIAIEYDESTLFGMSQPSYSKDHQEESVIRSKNKVPKVKRNQKRKRSENNSVIDSLKNNSKFYENHIKMSQKKIPKVSYFLIILSLIPILLFYITKWSKLPNAPDILLSFSRTFYFWYPIISVFIIVTPILMVIGIIRFLSRESPSRFAKISRYLSRPFLKAKSYLIGLEMLKRKKFRTILLIIGIFSSLFVFSNSIFNSTSRYPVIENNIRVGADLKLTANTPHAIAHLYNTSYTQKIDAQLENITNDKGVPLINNIMTYYTTQESSGQKVFYFNFTNYLKIIQEDGKFVPGNLVSQISKVIAFDNNASNPYPGAIVSQNFFEMNNLKIGQIYNMVQYRYDPQSLAIFEIPIKVIIVATYNQLPGIDAKVSSEYNNPQSRFAFRDMAIDFKMFNSSNIILNVSKFNQLVDLNLKASSNETFIQQSIYNSTNTLVNYYIYSFYDQEWNSPQLIANLSTTGFYGIVYFEFIILGILLAIGLASLLNSYQTENRYFFGILVSRGFGKKGIFKFMIAQLIIIFLLAILAGLISGIITSILFVKFTIYGMNLQGLGLPFFLNWLNILEILGSIVIICFSVYIATYLIQMRKSISQYMRKF